MGQWDLRYPITNCTQGTADNFINIYWISIPINIGIILQYGREMSISSYEDYIFNVLIIYELHKTPKFSFKSSLRRESVSFPFAQPSLPNTDAFAPVGIDIGTSLLIIFQVALELANDFFNHDNWSLPSKVFLFCSVSGKSFRSLYDLASKIKRSKSFPH